MSCDTRGKAASKRCQNCKCVRYCNAECQRFHWQSGHKQTCYKFDNVLLFHIDQLENFKGFAKQMKLVKDLKDMLFSSELGGSCLTNDWLEKLSEHYAAHLRQFITKNSTQTLRGKYLDDVNELAACYTDCFDIRQRFVTTVSWSLMTHHHLQLMENFIGPNLCRSIGSSKGWVESMLQCEVECVDIEAHEAVVPTFKTPSDRHADTLLLCWPPRENPMAYIALQNHVGSKLIFIGEQSGLTATHDKVAQEWEEKRFTPLPNWASMGGMIHAHLYMFQRLS